MKKINFKKVIAKNFLCFGEHGIELDFQDLGNIVLVKGQNLDTSKKGEEARLSSNGSGKSSIPEIVVYGLFGKTIKNPKKISHRDVMHINASKNLCVEIYWDNYKIERRRKPDSLKFWKDDTGKFDDSTELTLGGMPATQTLIENTLGLNYQTFINIFIFTDDNSTSFLECDAAEKRNIVENLLSLEKYRSYHENAKVLHKQHQASIKSIQTEIDYLESNLKTFQRNAESFQQKKTAWKQAKIEEIRSLGNSISFAEKEKIELEKNDDLKKYEEAQKKIVELLEKQKTIQLKIESLTSQKTELDLESNLLKADLRNVEQEKHGFALKKQELAAKGKSLTTVLEKIKNLEAGVKCDHCFGQIDPANYEMVESQHKQDLELLKKQYASEDVEFKKADAKIKEQTVKINETQSKLSSLLIEINKKESELATIRSCVTTLQKIQLPDSSKKKAGLEEKIKLLEQQIIKFKNELDGISPFDDMATDNEQQIVVANGNLVEKSSSLSEMKGLVEYYAFWNIAFGDAGIRKYVIDEIIPALNDNVNYWLNFLIDNKLEIKFDNELNETISKFPEAKNLSYHILSNGQRRRINLALSQSFAHVMSLNTGRYPSLVFLDEVTTNIDPVGVEGIYNMICELAKDKQVIVTTHDHDLLELLNGCQELNLKMKNGASNLV